MRVTCATVEEFLTNLESVKPSEVFQQRVYVSKTRRPLDGDKRTSATFSVTLQASAVIALEGNQGDYLLDYGEDCGVDYEDATQEREGTAYADRISAILCRFCYDHDLKVMPGVVDY